MNQPMQATIGSGLGKGVSDRPETILESRMGDLQRAIGELDHAVSETVRRLEPVLTPYPTAMTPENKIPKQAASPHIENIERLTDHIHSIRARLQEALSNAQI